MAVDPTLDLDALATLVCPSCSGFTEFKTRLSQTSGCSGAEITAICQEAALIAMREDINASFVSPAFLHVLKFDIRHW